MPPTNRTETRRTPERRVSRMRELERRVEQLEDEIAWLRRVLRTEGEREGRQATGPCPDCARGVLVNRNGELRCSTCGYSRFL